MKLVVLVPFLCVFTHTCARSVDVDLVEVDQTTREIVSTKIGCILEVNPNCPTKAVTCTIPRSVMRWSREELTTHLKSLMTVSAPYLKIGKFHMDSEWRRQECLKWRRDGLDQQVGFGCSVVNPCQDVVKFTCQVPLSMEDYSEGREGEAGNYDSILKMLSIKVLQEITSRYERLC